jgi:predicted metal-dependent HD superfamily phosphohydrolase
MRRCLKGEIIGFERTAQTMAITWYEQWCELVRRELGIAIGPDEQDGLGQYPDECRILEFCSFFERHPELHSIARAEILDCILGSISHASLNGRQPDAHTQTAAANVVRHAQRNPWLAIMLSNYVNDLLKPNNTENDAFSRWLVENAEVDHPRLTTTAKRFDEYGHNRDSFAMWERLRVQVNGPKNPWDSVWDLLDRHYSTPVRAYHNFDHVCECLDALELLSDCSDPLAARIALFFHDCVYITGSEHNETASAEIAHAYCSYLEMGHIADPVYKAILATSHRVPPGNDFCASIADADLSILAASSERYFEYTRQIRSEWSHVPDPEFMTGRAVFLTSLLDRQQLFWTSLGQDLWERAARHNISNELATLRK